MNPAQPKHAEIPEHGPSREPRGAARRHLVTPDQKMPHALIDVIVGRSIGRQARPIPQYVHPFVKTNKNDATDAEAICEALMRPTMRFAAVKSAEQQSVLMLHRARDLLVRQRTMLINALRGHCGEFGMVVAQGASKVTILIEMIEDRDDARLPALAREALGSLVEQLRMAQTQILDREKQLKAWHRTNEASRRRAAIPGVGVITATALVATIGDASQFHSGRQLAAWLGLVPRQYCSGGKARLGRIREHGAPVPEPHCTATVVDVGAAAG